MRYRYDRRYCGTVQAVIFDWAGTLIDHGSLAPIIALQRLFESMGVPISEHEARQPMGVEKRLHIQRLCEMPSVRERWVDWHGQAADADEIDRLYREFLPLQRDAIAERTRLIDGLLELSAGLRDRKIRIGTNTGYSRELLEPILAAAAAQGFVPDSTVCATEVPKGRPYPFMSLRNMTELGVASVAACVKVDDTETGIEEGLNAGMWTVGVAVSGNALGLDEADWQALPPEEQARRAVQARQSLARSGAHFIIDTIAELDEIIDEIDLMLETGEKP